MSLRGMDILGAVPRHAGTNIPAVAPPPPPPAPAPAPQHAGTNIPVTATQAAAAATAAVVPSHAGPSIPAAAAAAKQPPPSHAGPNIPSVPPPNSGPAKAAASSAAAHAQSTSKKLPSKYSAAARALASAASALTSKAQSIKGDVLGEILAEVMGAGPAGAGIPHWVQPYGANTQQTVSAPQTAADIFLSTVPIAQQQAAVALIAALLDQSRFVDAQATAGDILVNTLSPELALLQAAPPSAAIAPLVTQGTSLATQCTNLMGQAYSPGAGASVASQVSSLQNQAQTWETQVQQALGYEPQNTVTGTPGAPWQPNFTYAAGSTVVNGGYNYVTARGGRSGAAPGPQGPGGAIVDGSVTWYDNGLVAGAAPSGTTTAAGGQWMPSTAYNPGDAVTNAGNTYQCSTGGISAPSGGPVGTGIGIHDGSVTWSYVGTSTGTQPPPGGATYTPGMPWQPGFAYPVSASVSNQGSMFVSMNAGTSGAYPGPMNPQGVSVDGNIQWMYQGPDPSASAYGAQSPYGAAGGGSYGGGGDAGGGDAGGGDDGGFGDQGDGGGFGDPGDGGGDGSTPDDGSFSTTADANEDQLNQQMDQAESASADDGSGDGSTDDGVVGHGGGGHGGGHHGGFGGGFRGFAPWDYGDGSDIDIENLLLVVDPTSSNEEVIGSATSWDNHNSYSVGDFAYSDGRYWRAVRDISPPFIPALQSGEVPGKSDAWREVTQRDAGDVLGKALAEVLGTFDVGAKQLQMNTLKQVTVGVARALLDGGQKAIDWARGAAGDMLPSMIPGATYLPGKTDRDNVFWKLSWHRDALAKFSDPNAAYSPGADLQHWVMQAFVEANAAEEGVKTVGAETVSQMWTDMWYVVDKEVAKLPVAVRALVSSAASALTFPLWVKIVIGALASAAVLGAGAWAVSSVRR